MKPLYVFWLILLVIAALGVVVKSALGAETSAITGRITEVEDGDTIALTDDAGGCHVIRLSDIDTPETAHRPAERRLCGGAPAAWPPIALPGQPGGIEATGWMIRNGLDRRAAATCHETDRYGRKVCFVTVTGDRLSLNHRLLQAGWATVLPNPAWVRDRRSWGLEEGASAIQAGLWAWPIERRLTPAKWRSVCWGAVLDGRQDMAARCPGAVWP